VLSNGSFKHGERLGMFVEIEPGLEGHL